MRHVEKSNHNSSLTMKSLVELTYATRGDKSEKFFLFHASQKSSLIVLRDNDLLSRQTNDL